MKIEHRMVQKNSIFAVAFVSKENRANQPKENWKQRAKNKGGKHTALYCWHTIGVNQGTRRQAPDRCVALGHLVGISVSVCHVQYVLFLSCVFECFCLWFFFAGCVIAKTNRRRRVRKIACEYVHAIVWADLNMCVKT